MTTYADTARATLLIKCGTSRGSGFHFIHPEFVVTNNHVIEAQMNQGHNVVASSENGFECELELVASSPSDEHDFAILRTRTDVPEERVVLEPKLAEPLEIGTDLVFSGFPHGIQHLLVQRAIISGLVDEGRFYIDGSVNGGNSGGPIVDLSDGSLIGIVTQRRFLGGTDLEDLQEAAEQIQEHCRRIAGRGGVQIMGIDFGAFAALMADAMVLIKEVLVANANTGIGIGYSAKFITEECGRLGIL